MMRRTETAWVEGRPKLFSMMTSWASLVVELAHITENVPPDDVSGEPRAANWSDMPRRTWAWMWTFPSNTETRRAAFLLGKAALLLHRYATARGPEKLLTIFGHIRATLNATRDALMEAREDSLPRRGYEVDHLRSLPEGGGPWIMYRTNGAFAEALDRGGPRGEVVAAALGSTPREAIYVVTGMDVSRFVTLMLEVDPQ